MVGIALLPVATGLGLAASAPGQAGPGGNMPPPREAVDACRGAGVGDSCRFSAPGQMLSGHCEAGSGHPPTCRPAPAAPRSDVLAGSRVSTADVACGLSHDSKNAALGLESRYAWSCGAGVRRLTGNGIPDHPTGSFPNRGNPNRISVQDVSFRAPLTPERRDDAGMPVRISGYALNGVKFDPGTAESCTHGCANGGRGGGGTWTIEALGQSFFDFGVDANNAHVQPDGTYHYHGVPKDLLARHGETNAMSLIGWAVDGYPIYGRYGHDKAMDAKSALRSMRSSYRLKSIPDAGRPSTSIAPMGTFTQDYEYAAGSGDLDECNGRTDVTPEFPRGIYHYYATDAFPYVQRCVKGDSIPGGVRERGMPPRWSRG